MMKNDSSKPYGVLVLDGGNAALFAAMTAWEAGASVIMLECGSAADVI